MNKKHIKSLSLFLILLFIIITIATVSATDTNQTTDDTSPNAVTENIINDIIYEDNNNDKNIIETSEITTKNIQKNNNQTEHSKQSSNTIQSEITIGSTKTAYVEDKISVYGKLTAQGKAIPNATIYLYVGSDKYKITTSQYGNYNHNITIDSKGTKTIKAVFYATGNYLGNEAKTTVTVNQRTSEITVGSTKLVYVGDEVSIYGKLTSEGVAIANAPVRLYVAGTMYRVYTSQYGNYNFKLAIDSAGNKKITAYYPGSNVYVDNDKVIYFDAIQRDTEITVGSTKLVYVGNEVSIYGKLTSDGVALADKPVRLYVDGTMYRVYTSQYGNYNFKLAIDSVGNKKITAYYPGSNVYKDKDKVIYFDAEKRLTNITLGSTKNSYVDDEINIYGRLTSKGYSLPNREIKINIDGTTNKVTTNKYGDYKLKTTVTEEGIGNIKVTYTGNYMYNEATNNITYTVNKKNNITIGCAKEVLVGEKIKIYGKLTTRGKGAAYKQITITTENEEFNVTTSKYGNYNLFITPTTEGESTIQAIYTDTPSYNTVTTDTTFQANKKDTTITIGTAKTVYVGDKISVYGKLTSKGYALPYKQVKIIADGKTYDVTTSKYGNYNTNITFDIYGDKTITAIYEGSNTYINASNQTSTYADKKDTLLTLGSTNKTYVGNSINIYGKLSFKGNGLAYKQVIIEVNDDEYTVTTDKYGNYKLNVTAASEGTTNITSMFYGSYVYTESLNITNTKVDRKNSVLTANIVPTAEVGDIVTVYGKLTANNIQEVYQPITLIINGEYRYTDAKKDGNYAYSFIADLGKNTIEVYYGGNEFYKGSYAQTSVIGLQINKTVTMSITKDWNVKYIDGDPFCTHYTTVDAQYSRGVYVELETRGLEYPPVNKITKCVFYFKNNQGKIITRTVNTNDITGTSYPLINGYTPYKVDITYCKMTEKERDDFWNGY